MLSDNDSRRLERARLERFNECVRFQGILYLDLEHYLHLTCVDPSQVEATLANLPVIRLAAWLILGAEDLTVWHESKVVWTGETRIEVDFLLESELFEEVEDIAMTATTLDRGKVEAIAIEQFRSEVLAPEIEEIADSAVAQYLDSSDFEQYARDRLGQCLERWRGLLRQASANGAVATVEPEPSEAEAPEEAPFKFAANHHVSLYNAVTALIEDPKERLAMLRQMRRSTKKGKEFADRIVEFTPELRREKVREGIMLPANIDRVIVRLNK